jgi:hypothetical protein
MVMGMFKLDGLRKRFFAQNTFISKTVKISFLSNPEERTKFILPLE